MRKSINPLWVALLFVSLGANFSFATTYTWTNIAGGNWSQGANWSPTGPPTATDTAIVTNNGTYTVTINTAEAVNVLTLGRRQPDVGGRHRRRIVFLTRAASAEGEDRG